MYSMEQLNSKTNRFGLLFIFLLLFVGVLGCAFLTVDDNNWGVSLLSGPKNKGSDPNTKLRSTLSGHVTEMQQSSGEKWIVISVTIPENVPMDMSNPKVKSKPVTVESKTMLYRFHLSKNVRGANAIQGGEWVSVSFRGEPSEKEYVGVEEVKIQKYK